MTTRTSVVDYAIEASEAWQFSVIPIKPRSKEPYHAWKKRQTTPASKSEIIETWGNNRALGMGFVTGEVSGGLVVIDVDPDAGGRTSLAKLVQKHGALPDTPHVRTGGGGDHWYFRHSASLQNSASKLGAGIDIRAEGGLVVAPPSVHETGNAYEWVIDPGDVPIAELPKWIVSLLKNPNSNGTGPPSPTVRGDIIPLHQRHDELLRIGGKLIRAALPEITIKQALLATNAELCKPPLEESEVTEIAEDIIVRYPHDTDEGLGLKPVPISAWIDSPTPPTQWTVEGIVPSGGLTLLSAPPKSGKSIFARAVSFSVASDTSFLGRKVSSGPVLYLALEENPNAVKLSFRRLGVNSETPLNIHFGRFHHSAFGDVTAHILANKTQLLVIDTIGRIRDPSLDTNDYVSTASWLEPILYLSHEVGVACLVIHHDTKSGRHAVDFEALSSILGSTSIAATIDQHISLRRKSDGIRTFSTTGRFEDIPETVLGFDPATERLSESGTKADLNAIEVQRDIMDYLAKNGETAHQELKETINHRSSLVTDTLLMMVKQGLIKRSGTGTRGASFIYSLSDKEGTE